ncbi:hotdog fold domain-containing protein [Brevibacterium antiquum]|uniref:hotdog fold domain-containing protein n=1 Tax=Brevibacterium antiquum TaxID=234835 RepID=UPI0018E0415C|nr:hotdog fold domain-containing protein [Brevibacterium antiquum]
MNTQTALDAEATGGTESTGTVAPAANLRIWQKLQKVPFGNWLFTRAVCFKVPYFRTVHPLIHELRPGLCRVSAPNRRGVHNHLGTYHAIASCNMAEIAAGVMVDATIPPTHRWIPMGMTVEYKSKSTTGVTSIARLDAIPEFGDEPMEVVVPVEVLDADGQVYVSAEITMYVSRKKSA